MSKCPDCAGSVVLATMGSIRCSTCGRRWSTVAMYKDSVAMKDLAKGKDYVEEDLKKDLEKLVLIAQRQFVDEFMENLSTSVQQFTDWLVEYKEKRPEMSQAEKLEAAKVDGARGALQQLLTGFQQALGEEDE